MSFGLFKSSEEKAKERFAKELNDDLITISNIISGQIDMIVFFEKKNKKEILRESYTQMYIFGAFDAATVRWGTEIRKKIGRSVIEMGYLPYLTTKFEIPNSEAQLIFNNVFAIHSKDHTNAAIVAGGADGLEALQSNTLRAPRLALHFTPDADSPSNITEQEMDAFQKYRRQETDNYIKRRNQI